MRHRITGIGAALAAAICAHVPSASAQPSFEDPVQVVERTEGDGRLSRQEDERDRRIRELEARIAALEAAIASGSPAAGTDPRPETVPGPARPRPDPAREAIDLLSAERALERTLVRRGALLLSPGQREIQPSFIFVRNDEDIIPTLVEFDDGELASGAIDSRRDEFIFALAGSLGLPWSSQLDVSASYTLANEVDRLLIGGASTDETTRRGRAFNDVRIGLSKTVFQSEGALPDLIGRIDWQAPTGDQLDDGVSFGNGFSEITGSLTALARQDPLVFTGTLAYTAAFEDDGVKPGDQLALGATAFLAVSPETSMRFGFAAVLSDEVEIDGALIPGSGAQSASLEFGFSSVLTRRTVIDIGVEIGLTDDSPSYAFVISFPVRLP